MPEVVRGDQIWLYFCINFVLYIRYECMLAFVVLDFVF